jgi:tight adherence protein B
MKKPFALLAIAVIGALVAAPAMAQPGGGVRVLDVGRDGDRLTFTVVTPGGSELKAESFKVSVNQLPAADIQLAPIQSSVRASGAVLVVDTSGSMKGPPIEAARDAVSLFVSSVEPQTEIGLVTFSSEVRQASDYTTDHAGLTSVGEGLQANGETALHDALMTALTLAEERTIEQRNIVLLTDGADTASDSSFAQVQAAALASQTRVFIVGLKSPDYDPRSIRSLAEDTHGAFVQTEKPAELIALFGDIAQTLVSRYTVSVHNPDPGASEAEISVQVLLSQRGIETGVGKFEIGAPPTPEGGPQWSVESIPVPVMMLFVFAAMSLLVYIGIESLRDRRNSPSDRVQWYVDPPPGEVDKEAFVSAAVIERAKEIATQFAQRAGFLERLEAQLDSAGIKWRGGEVLVASVGIGGAGAVFGFALSGTIGALFFAVMGGFGPISYIKIKVSRRRAAFMGQLPDVLLLLSGALKAGHSIQQAMAAVGEDAKPPAAEEFRRTMAEVRLGANLDDALEALGRRIGVLDFDWTILAIQIQREVGGNLAEILEIISETIRERDRLGREIKALTAEGRMSGMVLGLLPVAMALLLYTRSPDYLEPLYTTSKGLKMLAVTGALMIVGFFWMKKIVKIEV